MKIQCAICNQTGEIPDEAFNKMRDAARAEAKALDGGDITGNYKAICHPCMNRLMADQARQGLEALGEMLAERRRAMQKTTKTPENKPVLH